MTTPKPVLLTISFIFTLATSFGQTKDGMSTTLSVIKRECRQINSFKSYKRITIYDAGEFLGHSTDNGASLSGYYKGDSLVKIVEWIGLSNKVIQNEYYIDHGKLIFVQAKESDCQYNNGAESFEEATLKLVFTGHYYYDNEKLFDTATNNKNHSNEPGQHDPVELLATGKGYMLVLNARKK